MHDLMIFSSLIMIFVLTGQCTRVISIRIKAEGSDHYRHCERCGQFF